MIRSLSGLLVTVALLLMDVVMPAPGHAETVDWSLDRAIECPLRQSLPTKVLTRTVVFPGGAISECPAFWSDDQLFVKIIKNTAVLELRDPLFSGTMQFYDDRGDLFLINVRAAKPEEGVDEMLLLRPRAAPEPAAITRTNAGQEGADAALGDMMAAMVAQKRGADLAVMPATHVEHGTILPGRRIFSNSRLSIDLLRSYHGPALCGYACLLSYGGEESLRLDERRLWFPGALAVCIEAPADSRQTPDSIVLAPHQAITIYFVSTAE